ncbi:MULTISPECIES: acylphosphatase [Shewanella]|uniref:acylphosphatase n=1 Tax=Shewanella salipaludis TaxID=2723052 RepID=A0A972FVW9_9GAMM|nr:MULTISPECIES: acylphosphatase [Shewanella]MCE9687806.1 acylphosphatase [Shewanella sp. AS16]NMH63587.1 acylphosphatase [Shewanella salipaludis]
MKRVLIKVEGQVQGVDFRRYTVLKARELGITGYVSNQADGSVLILAQGSHAAVNNLLLWCDTGSPLAKVTRITVEEDEANDIYLDFSIVQS